MTAAEDSVRFGPLLQRHRVAAGLTQEELAERAAMSRRGISDLERGARRPLAGTARRLATALEVGGEAREQFISAARSRTAVRLHDPKRADSSNLPVAVSSFVGRKRELAHIQSVLRTSRLLTLTGTGGVGKTRLAIEVARSFPPNGPQRVCLVELASITEDAAVPRETIAALGLSEQAGSSPIETLRSALRNQEWLLILDNCEQVLDGCAELVCGVLGVCPGVRMLATSRERLGIIGETTWHVPSMKLPSERMSIDDFKECDAVQLFARRARALVADFAVSEQNAQTVADVCARLDGIPLAIELAAAQLPVLSVAQIAERLEDALGLLVRGNRSAPPRQQTLEATIAWSYALLDPAEQLLFERLSIFAGGWTLEQAQQVCADSQTNGGSVCITHSDVLDLLSRLVIKSLVIATPDAADSTRYDMLKTLRQFGHQRLVEHGELDATRDRHADALVKWARARRWTNPMPRAEAFRRLVETAVELDNLRVALRWVIEQRDTDRALALGAALRWFWFRQGLLSEGYQWCSEILALPASHVDTEEFGHVVAAAALLASRQATIANEDAERLHQRAIALWRSLADQLELARSLSQLGYLYRSAGRLTDARGSFQEGARLSDERDGRDFQVIAALNWIGLGETLYDEEKHREALAPAGRALAIGEDLDYALIMSWTKRAIGLIHYQLGEHQVARRLLEESLAEARREQGTGWWLADALACVAQMDIDIRRFDRAGTLLREALKSSAVLGDRRMIARCLERVAYLAATRGWRERAVRLAAAASSLRMEAGVPRTAVETRTLNRWLAPAEHGLESVVIDRLRREAARMDLEGVLAYALAAATRQEAILHYAVSSQG